MADDGVAIGNYKGVMLCNRPVGPSADTAPRSSDGKPPPFKAGIPAERVNPRGYDPVLMERIIAAKDPDSVCLVTLYSVIRFSFAALISLFCSAGPFFRLQEEKRRCEAQGMAVRA